MKLLLTYFLFRPLIFKLRKKNYLKDKALKLPSIDLKIFELLKLRIKTILGQF
jgi:hypothetical protein